MRASTAAAGLLAGLGASPGMADTDISGRTETLASTTTAEVYTGTGAIEITGGTVTLTGANTYSGGTTVNTGTILVVGDGATSGALGTGVVTLLGTLVFDRSDTVVLAHATQASGLLRQSGSGTLVVTSAIDQRQGLVIDVGGTIQLGNGGATGSNGSGSTVNDGALVFNRSGIVTHGPISGTGTVTVGGTGTVVFRAENTYSGLTTINAGATLQVGAGSLGTLGSGAVVNNGALTFTRGGDIAAANAISGTGALTQAGTGTLTLSGASTYGGGTTITSGTLAIAADTAIGLATGALAFNGGTLRLDASFDLASTRAISITAAGGTINTNGYSTTIAQGITGAGALRVTGAGTLALTSANSYLGGTTIAGGTLAIGADLAIGAPTGALAFDGGTLRFDASFDLTPARAISIAAAGGTINTNGQTTTIAQGITGAGGLRVSGAGGLVLTGTNAYAGGTTIDAGARLQLGNGTTTGSIQGNVVNNGTLAFNRSDPVTFAGAISGSGTVRLEGAGEVVLTGANTFTGGLVIANGSLRIGDGGSIAGDVTNNAMLIFAQSGRTTLDPLSGTGALRQDGTGTTVLTGTNTYTGATAVNAGTLVVNGSIATSSGVMVAAGGTIGGDGTLPTTVIANGGTISPGNSPGTITVQGNLTLNAGSLYIAEVRGAVADRIDVTGTASLAGTVRLVPLGGAYSFSTPYTLLSAQGGRSGTFTTVDTTGSFGDGVASAVSYTATDVLLTLTPRPLAPIVEAPAAANPSTGPRLNLRTPANAYAVAAGIDRAVAGGADPSAFFPIYNLPAAAIPGAVNQISGEIHTAAPAMAVSAADQFLAAMLDPSATGRILGQADAGIANKAGDAPGQSRYAVWAAVFGATGHSDGAARQGSARRDLDDAHVAVGADIRIDARTVAGFALGFGSARATLAGGLGKAEGDVFQAGVYGMTRFGPVAIAAALGYARIENDVSRAVPVLGGALASSYATDAWSGRIQASVPVFERDGLSLSPFLAFQATQVQSPTIQEGGRGAAGAAALTIAGRDDVTSRAELGAQLNLHGLFGEAALAGHLRAGWAHYVQRDAGLGASITGLPGTDFTVQGARGPRNAALLAAGIEARITPALTIAARFDSEIAGSAARYGGTAQIRYSF